MDCCLPSYGVPTVFIVCYVAVMWLLCTSPGVWNYVASLYCYSTVISLLNTTPGAIITPPGVCQFDCFTIVWRVWIARSFSVWSVPALIAP